MRSIVPHRVMVSAPVQFFERDLRASRLRLALCRRPRDRLGVVSTVGSDSAFVVGSPACGGVHVDAAFESSVTETSNAVLIVVPLTFR